MDLDGGVPALAMQLVLQQLGTCDWRSMREVDALILFAWTNAYCNKSARFTLSAYQHRVVRACASKDSPHRPMHFIQHQHKWELPRGVVVQVCKSWLEFWTLRSPAWDQGHTTLARLRKLWLPDLPT